MSSSHQLPMPNNAAERIPTQRLPDPSCLSHSSLSVSSEPFSPWQPIQTIPALYKVYFIPDATCVPHHSIIYKQKREHGFFRHPILVVKLDHDSRIAYFYALTSFPPEAIGDLQMFLRVGTTTLNEGSKTLQLARGSACMQRDSYVNLEQRFAIEWEHLRHWAVHVAIDFEEHWKLDSMIHNLEAKQNRYIYKPLPADFSNVKPGTVVMLPNPLGSSTFGAPVVVLVNNFPNFRYLRIKLQANSSNFASGGPIKYHQPRQYCLKLCEYPELDEDDLLVLLFEPGSRQMREPSYVEIQKVAVWERLEKCKTWCVPPVRIQEASIQQLLQYIDDLPLNRHNALALTKYRKQLLPLAKNSLAQNKQAKGFGSHISQPPTRLGVLHRYGASFTIMPHNVVNWAPLIGQPQFHQSPPLTGSNRIETCSFAPNGRIPSQTVPTYTASSGAQQFGHGAWMLTVGGTASAQIFWLNNTNAAQTTQSLHDRSPRQSPHSKLWPASNKTTDMENRYQHAIVPLPARNVRNWFVPRNPYSEVPDSLRDTSNQ
ncbi:hypothetical protein N0V90_007976 [Kalmusia sp. IMI 367209]|nr:hypothetical protein N0V90_007976 [Kalmusia sp. IMI 367209]